MKRTLSLLIVLAVSVTLCACVNSPVPSAPAASASINPTQAPEATPTAAVSPSASKSGFLDISDLGIERVSVTEYADRYGFVYRYVANSTADIKEIKILSLLFEGESPEYTAVTDNAALRDWLKTDYILYISFPAVLEEEGIYSMVINLEVIFNDGTSAFADEQFLYECEEFGGFEG